MAQAMDSRDSIMETLQSLLRMKNRAANEHEAAAAAAQITRLLLKHNLALREVENHAGPEGDPLVEETYYFLSARGRPTSRSPSWKVKLAWVVAESCLCRALFTPGKEFFDPPKPGKFHFLGRRSNVQVAEFFYQYLERTISDLARRTKKNGSGEPRGRSWWNSWHLGCVETLRNRLQDEKNMFCQSSELCRDLVQTKSREVDDFLRARYPRLGLGRGGILSDPGGYSAGQAAGESIQIRRGVERNPANQKFLG
jgi:hypothetical protein